MLVSWVRHKVHIFKVSHYLIFLYNVTIVQRVIYHCSFVLNSLQRFVLRFCCIQCQRCLKIWVLCSALVHFSGFRPSNPQIGLSSKHKAEFIIIWGNSKFTTKAASEITDSQKLEGLSWYPCQVYTQHRDKKSVVTWPENAELFKRDPLLGQMFEESL